MQKEHAQTPSAKAFSAFGFKENIVLQHIHFRYPESSAEALKDIHIVIPKGSTIAFVGPTGSGKTTIVDVIMGLLVPDKGDVTVDKKTIFNNLGAWQTCIGYVPQFIYLMNDTIKHNVAFGVEDKKIDEERFQRAAAIAQLDEFIDRLPQRENTNIGEHGVRLSGGQRQRIGIARALYHDPDVLIMDEATSALDNNTERKVIEAVSKTSGKTIIMIAHRLSSVLNCDCLYFLKDGRIHDKGTYADLYQKNADFLQMTN
jgi:ATP-binding cassette subfamily C protein